jgi:hypothetical protein
LNQHRRSVVLVHVCVNCTMVRESNGREVAVESESLPTDKRSLGPTVSTPFE